MEHQWWRGQKPSWMEGCGEHDDDVDDIDVVDGEEEGGSRDACYEPIPVIVVQRYH